MKIDLRKETKKQAKNKRIIMWTTTASVTLAAIGVVVPMGISISENVLNTNIGDNNNQGGSEGNNNPGDNNNNPDENNKPGGDNNNQGGDNNQGGNDNEQEKPNPNPDKPKTVELNNQEIKHVGLFDELVKNDNTQIPMEQYWSQLLNSKKELIIKNKNVFSQTELDNLTVEVKNNQTLDLWIKDNTNYLTYADWSKKIDLEILFSSNNNNNKRFTIKSLGDLREQLNNYKSSTITDKTGIEALILESGYKQPKSNQQLSYEIADSQLSIEKNKELLEIHVLEKNNGNLNKDLKLLLPLSDIIISNTFDVSIKNNNSNNNIQVPSSPISNTFVYDIGIDPTLERDYKIEKVLIQSNNKNTDLKTVNSEQVLTSLNFAKKENNKLIFNNDVISRHTNIYNVNWNAEASQPKLSQSITNWNDPNAKDYITDIKLTATPFEGHQLVGEPIVINLIGLVLENSYNLGVTSVNEHTSLITAPSYTDRQKFQDDWIKDFGKNHWNNIVQNEIGQDYFANTGMNEWHTLRPFFMWNAQDNSLTIQYYIKPATNYSWGNSQLDQFGKLFNLHLPNIKIPKK